MLGGNTWKGVISHFSEEAEAYPGNAGSGAVTLRRKQRRIQVMQGVGQSHF